jgi:hypothetical protein
MVNRKRASNDLSTTAENTEEAINNGQSRETANLWHIRRRKTK